ncbi:MAG: ABC-F family ATP-binding cassette domain-containing protein [Pseudomonadota bacterium]
MLRIEDITYRIEGRPLFEGASAVIPTGHKVGLVGRNGTGKTTLFRLIQGQLTLDGGAISIPKGARLGGVSQEVPSSSTSLLDTVLAADVERASLLAEAETATAPDRIAEIQIRLADIEAHSAEARAASILMGLGFDTAAQARPCSDFSGGWRMRVALAAVLFSQPDLLLLDEPTNYLDLEGSVWLEAYLARYPHTILLISHDRGLLTRSVGAILHLDRHDLTLYQGNYETFARIRQERAAQAQAEYAKQQAARAHMQSFVDRFRYKASKARQAQSRLKALERLSADAPVIEGSVSGFNFPSPEALSPPIIRLDQVSVGYNDTPVLKRLNLRIDQDDRIALLGANGQGKSTLSKLLSDRLSALEGDKHASSKLRIGYFAQHQVDELELEETPLQHLQRERPEETPAKLRARLAQGGLGAEIATTQVRKLSGGQKARLSLLLATLDAPHMIILDEPTNHLDIESREALARALNDYDGAVILVSHDPHLIEMVADRLWLVKDGTVAPYDEDLDSYRRMLLGEKPRTPKAEKPKAKPKAPSPSTLKAEIAKCEARVEKLRAMLNKLDAKFAEPGFYQDTPMAELTRWQAKHAEVLEAIDKAEALWLTALEAQDAQE